MRIHCLQHVPFETPGEILKWADLRNYDIQISCLYKKTTFPALSSFDFLVIMGGPMSLHDEKQFPWLAAEKKFLKKAVEPGQAHIIITLRK